MKRIVFFVVLVCGDSYVFGQEALQLSFKEAVRIGLDNNIVLKQERNNLTAVNASKNSAYASLAPNVNARALAFRIDGNSFFEQTGEVINAQSNRASGSINADITLFNGLSNINRIKRDNHRLDAQLSVITRTEQDIISDVAIQYLNLLQDQEQVTIAKQNLDNQQVLLDQIKLMFELGSRAITDKYDQDFQVKSAELEVIRAENRYINDKAILSQTLMIDPSTNYILENPGWSVDDINIGDYNIQDLFNEALANRADLKSTTETEKAAFRNIKVQKGAYIPTLTGFYGLSSAYSDLTVDREFSEQFLKDNRLQQYGFNLSIPIFNGLRNRSNVISARVQHENALLGIENQEILIKTEVLRTYQNFRDVALAYQVSLVQFEAGQKSMETQRESYNLGITSLIELSRANNVFVEGQTSLSRSKYAFMFQKVMMEYTVGTLNFDMIPD